MHCQYACACERKKSAITKEHNLKADEMAKEYATLNISLSEASKEQERLAAKMEYSKRRLENLKKSDDRGFLSKLFSDTHEVSIAKEVIHMDKTALDSALKEKNFILKQIEQCKQEQVVEERTYKKLLENCKPVLLRPTKEELLEERKISLRIAEIARMKNEEDANEN